MALKPLQSPFLLFGISTQQVDVQFVQNFAKPPLAHAFCQCCVTLLVGDCTCKNNIGYFCCTMHCVDMNSRKVQHNIQSDARAIPAHADGILPLEAPAWLHSLACPLPHWCWHTLLADCHLYHCSVPLLCPPASFVAWLQAHPSSASCEAPSCCVVICM